MDSQQIQTTLLKVYQEEKHRVIFWYDTDAEFQDIISSLDLAGVNIIFIEDEGALALKIKLEFEDPEGQYLIYAPYAEPVPEDDWLLDIKLYSYTFHADRASIILNELGLTSQSLRPYLNSRKKFFRSQDRTSRLQKWLAADDSEDDIDLKMFSVITRVDHPNLFAILIKLFGSFCPNDVFAPEAGSKLWEDINKLELGESFWGFIQKEFGYGAEKPSIHDLLIRILVSDFANNLKNDLPGGLAHFLLPQGACCQNCSVFLSQWKTTLGQFKNYNHISKYYSKTLNIEEILSAFEPADLVNVSTFDGVERRIISSLRDTILTSPDEFEPVLDIISKRRDTHWLTATAEGEINLFSITYDALEAAISLFRLRKKYTNGFSYPTAKEMFVEYSSELFRFDQLYRHFHEATDQVEMAGWDVLKNLVNSIDDLYSNWLMDQLAMSWDSFMEPDSGDGLLDKWSFFSPYNQYQFFDKYVKKEFKNKARSRVFVIISDAFRYEVAEELTRGINSKYRLKASLEPMLGVLPSYTSLGMASLLPHKQISFKPGTANILVDGKPAASLEQRSAILAGKNGVAIKADELMAMSKSQGRDFIKPYQVVYIYHNQIDALGDKAVTESKTFSATRTTIDELGALVRFLVNNLNGSYVLATADHGYIYQEKVPSQIDKSVLQAKPAGTIVAKKRYIIGHNLGETPKAWSGSFAVTAKAEGDMEFWVPKGTNRFHFQGGARFFHGGAMLQEIVLPVVIIQELRGHEKEKSQVNKVGVSLLGSNKKIVTNRHRFEIIQTDCVSARVIAQTLLISLRDGNELISNEETVTFDSQSSDMDERKKSIMLMLKSAQFDSKKEYYLVLRDSETEIEYARYPVNIDLALMNDF